MQRFTTIIRDAWTVDNGTVLVIATDNGEHQMYSQDTMADTKRLNKFINQVEASNPGYKWQWDESTLKGLLID